MKKYILSFLICLLLSISTVFAEEISDHDLKLLEENYMAAISELKDLGINTENMILEDLSQELRENISVLPDELAKDVEERTGIAGKIQYSASFFKQATTINITEKGYEITTNSDGKEAYISNFNGKRTIIKKEDLVLSEKFIENYEKAKEKIISLGYLEESDFYTEGEITSEIMPYVQMGQRINYFRYFFEEDITIIVDDMGVAMSFNVDDVTHYLSCMENGEWVENIDDNTSTTEPTDIPETEIEKLIENYKKIKGEILDKELLPEEVLTSDDNKIDSEINPYLTNYNKLRYFRYDDKHKLRLQVTADGYEAEIIKDNMRHTFNGDLYGLTYKAEIIDKEKYQQEENKKELQDIIQLFKEIYVYVRLESNI